MDLHNVNAALIKGVEPHAYRIYVDDVWPPAHISYKDYMWQSPDYYIKIFINKKHWWV